MAFATSPATALNPWLQILSALEKKVIRQSFETWLKPTRFSHAAGRTLYVRVPSTEFQHIGEKYGDLIQEAIDLNALEFDDVSFVTAEEDPSIPPLRRDGGFGPIPSHAPTAPPAPATRTPEQRRFDWSTAAQLNSALHVRCLRDRQRQPVCARRGAGGGRAAFARLQSAVPVWRRGYGQDAPDARHRPRGEAPAADREYLLRLRGKIYQRDDQLHPQRSHDQLPRPLPHGGCAADRRHPVHLAEGAHAGGVLPHLQRAARSDEAGGDRLGPSAQGADRDRGAAALALRVGPDRRHSTARS